MNATASMTSAALIHHDSPYCVALGSSFIVPGAALLLLIVGLAVPGFFLLMWLVGGYNRLVSLRNRYKSAYSDVNVELTHRYDLIPDLVEIAKGYMQTDRGALEALTAARHAASGANVRATLAPGDIAAMRDLSGAESALAGTLTRFFTVVANCPDLQSDARMVSLTQKLTSSSTKAALAGKAYNDAAIKYNTLRETFPANLLAGPLSFGAAELLVLNGCVPNPV